MLFFFTERRSRVGSAVLGDGNRLLKAAAAAAPQSQGMVIVQFVLKLVVFKPFFVVF